ncbi:MAG: sulfotransferase [Desulfobacterales bacterium]|nr:sulfotransferase [Desulfobacterales bacterium]
MPPSEPTDIPAPTIVVGMHNSGTSILAELLHEHGLFLGANMSHYENRFFTKQINEQMMMGGGGNWANLPIMSIDEVLSFKDNTGHVIREHWLEEFKALGYDGVSHWGFKDPRTCVFLPLYLEVFPDAKVLHIVRNRDDVAASLSRKRKKGVDRMDDRDHWKNLAIQYVDRVRYCKEHYSIEYLEIQYEDFCRNPEPLAETVFNFVGIEFTKDARDFANQRLYTYRIGSARPLHQLFTRFRRYIERVR